jgi:hypothetical protein
MGLKLKLTGLLLVAMALTTTVFAIDILKGVTYWDVAGINGIDVGEFNPTPWRFESADTNANAGTVEATGFWSGRWGVYPDSKKIGQNIGGPVIGCEMTSGGNDWWYMTFINNQWFVAWTSNEDGTYDLYRLGKARSSGYNIYESALQGTTLTNAISLEENTDRPGMNLKNYALSTPNPQICANDCANDPNCKAFTYVKPGVRGSNSVPECWLKNGVPNPVPGECCVSGVK